MIHPPESIKNIFLIFLYRWISSIILWFQGHCLARAGTATRRKRYVYSLFQATQRVTVASASIWIRVVCNLAVGFLSRGDNLLLGWKSNLVRLPRFSSAQSSHCPLTFLAPFNPLTSIQFLVIVCHRPFPVLYISEATYRQSSQSSQSAQLPSIVNDIQKPAYQAWVHTSRRIRIARNPSNSRNYYQSISAN